jgi:hypothetical protein
VSNEDIMYAMTEHSYYLLHFSQIGPVHYVPYSELVVVHTMGTLHTIGERLKDDICFDHNRFRKWNFCN